MDILSVDDLVARYTTLSDAEKVKVSAILQELPQLARTAAPQAALALIERIELLRVLEPDERALLAERLAPVEFSEGAFMVQEGAQDNCLYLIGSGDAEVRVTVEGSNITKPVARLGPGDFFGEMALLTGQPRKASVIAHTPVQCYRLIKEDFDDLLRGRPEIVDALAAILARRLVELRAVQEEKFALLELLPDAERQALTARLREAVFEPGAVIVRQGARERWMGIMITGEAEVRVEQEGSRASRQVALLRSGDFFGEMSLLSDEPRSATIVARSRVDCYVIDAEPFQEVAQEFPGILDRLEQIRTGRKAELRAVRTGMDADARQQQVRASETRLKRRIRRFFALDFPVAGAGKLLAEPSPRVATGRFLFEFRTPSGRDKPLHNMYVELWHRDVIEVFLGCATTARDGTFEVWYDATDLGGRVNLELRLFESQHSYTREGDLQLVNRLAFTLPGARGVTDSAFAFGDLRVPYWEYDPADPMPRALIVEQGDPPQSYAPGRSMLMLKAVAPIEVIKQKHLMEYRLTGKGPSIDRIQRDYPESVTVRLERERPGYTRTDEYFGERMLNGMCASVFDRDESNPGRFRIYHHWNSYEQDGVHALPNVDMRFEVRDERLYPVQITLHLREPGVTAPNAPTQRLTFTPDDGERWMQAKRIARVSAAMVAELDNHLTTTHLNTEQYAIAAYRNLRKNPLRFLLFPHLKEVVLINHSGNDFLMGERGYFTTASALTLESVKLRIRQVMGTLDWKNWRPIQPICETHSYAKAANLFWDALSEYVDDFFEQYAEEIAEHWYEVHMFSRDLVEHSPPDFLCRFLTGAVAGRPAEARRWFTTDERMDVDIPRYVVNGVPRAVQPVTQSDVPASSDIENMKQVCRYTIYHATFKHTWANARQYVDGGEILYNCLGLRYGENGLFVPESDHSVAPPPDRASQLLWISYMLSRSVYGHIMRNEDHDINPAFLETLEERRAEFAAVGLDIDTIQSRTNI